ncbi:helicase-exonuclease AddAB subunit AddB [Sporolactobacillus shoreae]|uniref:ATP-dependent helicase/deoxyribonuclease subunit B n=1 Tax=Sporolactobacillus shoreae TaxID=1465501 RepID=A0A4Z0GJW8_9BACL|nr:helicase-exonuclease AddAB subunit AddB [Sporolactobacillus shoreae]TGA97131.1 helicase-exonuclease AddAB subunit AddB [Sporolactobacillus shoreae]
MSVRFILGRPGTGKTALCMEEVRTRLRENPSGSPLIYIVPEHMTFGMEYAFAGTPGLGGMTRLNVYSMPRLALRVLQQSGGMTRIHLNSVGLAMLLRKVVEENKKVLRLFRKASEQTGFYSLLGDTIAEFKHYCLTPEQIATQSESAPADDLLLKDKLHDLSVVYQSFEEALEGKYVDSDDYLNLMAGKIAETKFLREAEVWIDGFQTMTPEEQLVVAQLMGACRRVTVILGSDKAYDRLPDEFSAFRHPALLYLQLKEAAENQHLTVEPILTKNEVVRAKTSGLRALNLNFGDHAVKEGTSSEGIVLTEAVNRREEVEQAARNLIGLARDRNLHFRDITVLVRDLDSYRDLIETVFTDYGIPIFIDRKKSMKHHPLIELIRSVLETLQQNWHYEPVFRCVKTDLLIPAGSDLKGAREAMDQLENYVMAYGIYGEKKWTDKEPWTYHVYRGLSENEVESTDREQDAQKKINYWRKIVAEPLAWLAGQLKEAQDVRRKCEALYEFLIRLSVPAKLEHLAQKAEKDQRLEESREHGQAWKAVIDLFDQCVEGAGNAKISGELFTQIIGSGLDSLEFALVPPAFDQVLVGSMDRMRSSNPRAVFLLGVNEGVIPSKPSEQGLFSGDDRKTLEEGGMHVADDDDGQMAWENELIFRALSMPEERLYLSYPLASEGGEALKASPLVGRLRRLFPDLPVRLALSEPRSLPESEQIGFINSPRKTISYLATQIREWRRGYGISDIWWDAYNWFTPQTNWGPKAKKILSGLFSRNDEHLSKAMARDLYGNTIQASVSRMELFSACPFSQFASYGLRLREREVFQLAAPDIGQLFHLAVKKMTEEIMKNHGDWGELSPEDCDRLAARTVDAIAPRLQRQILSSSGRYRYLQRKLEQVVARVARVMSRHARVSGFTPVSLELPFGPGQPVPPLAFSLDNGCKMEIVGRIDRVDKAEDANHRLLLRIIDYKSGAKDLNLNDVYYGLALQMLAYLDVAITNSKHWLGTQAEPAGVLYFHMHNPSLIQDKKISSEAVEDELYKTFKMKGLLLEDEEALKLTDLLPSGGHSEVAPFGIKRDGSYYKGSSLATPEQFGALRNYAKDRMTEIGEKITDGDVRIAPFKLKERIPCTFCPYRPVCQFDQSQPGNAFRQLKKIPDEHILKELTEKGGKDS